MIPPPGYRSQPRCQGTSFFYGVYYCDLYDHTDFVGAGTVIRADAASLDGGKHGEPSDTPIIRKIFLYFIDVARSCRA